MSTERLNIDLTYLGPNNILIYPIYSQSGEKILDARTILTTEKINEIIEKYGKTVYYSFSDEMSSIPNHRIQQALNTSKDITDEILNTDKISKVTYKESEMLIDSILTDLQSTDTKTIKLLKNLKNFDDYTYNHSVNVLLLSSVFATKLGTFSEDEKRSIALGAYLHDIGKIKIEKDLLNKKGKLSENEFTKMKRHPQIGYEILKHLTSNDKIVQQIILFHHEKLHNRGYYGLEYEYLAIYPKLVSLCDIFDALTSRRPYRDAIPPALALIKILNLINDHFDYDIINNFINEMGPIINGSKYFYAKDQICELSTNELALIIDYSSEDIIKPTVITFCKVEKKHNKIGIKFYDKPVKIDLNKHKKILMTNILIKSHRTDSLKDKLLERLLTQITYSPKNQ